MSGGSDPGVEKARIVRQGFWLFVATVLNSGQGVIFWAIASRLVSPEDIGIAASLLTLGALATAAALFGFDQSLIRFLPEVQRPRRLFGLAMLVSGAAAGAIGGVSVLVVYSQVHSLPESLVRVLPFAGAALALLAIGFRLTNILVVTAGHSAWVMIQSTILGLGKIAVLVILAAFLTAGTAVVLWSFGVSYAVALLVGAVVGLAMWPAFRPGKRVPTGRDITSFSLGNYASTNLWTLPDRIAPSLILIVLSAAATSFFYYGQLVALTLFYLPESICTSAFAHAARRGEHSSERIRSLAPALGVIAIVLAAAAIVLAPQILWVLGGPSYADHATLLRLYALSTVPMAGVFYLQSVYNVERRMRDLVVIGGIAGMTTLGALAIALALRFPVDDLPVAWVVGNTAGLAWGWSRSGPAPSTGPTVAVTLAGLYPTIIRPAVRDAFVLARGLLRPLPRAGPGESPSPADSAPGPEVLPPP